MLLMILNLTYVEVKSEATFSDFLAQPFFIVELM